MRGVRWRKSFTNAAVVRSARWETVTAAAAVSIGIGRQSMRNRDDHNNGVGILFWGGVLLFLRVLRLLPLPVSLLLWGRVFLFCRQKVILVTVHVAEDGERRVKATCCAVRRRGGALQLSYGLPIDLATLPE